MKDTTYFWIIRIITCFHRKSQLLGVENLPKQGAAVFVANHLGPEGPIDTVCTVPLRFYPWIVADQLDKEKAAEYLRIDFVEPSLKLKPPLSKVVAKGISLISVSLLSSMGCIPVNRKNYDDVQDTLGKCITLLEDGKIVLVFPEESAREIDSQTRIRPFLKGFTRMGELYYEKTGEPLSFYPVANHQSKKVMVGTPVDYNPDNPPGKERRRLLSTLENQVRSMVVEMDQRIP